MIMVYKINYEFLEENDNYDDANIELEASRVKKSIDDFLLRNPEKKYGMIWYVWPFGCGKSSVINKIKSTDKSWNNKWLQFDAWKYPDRKELWDWFVLDTISNLGKSSRKEITNTIETWLTKNQQKTNTIVDLISSGAGLAKLDIWSWASLQLNIPTEVKDFFKNTGSKVCRIEEYQNLLLAYFIELSKDNYDGNIYIVIEDIDRGNINEWLTFLETLRYFLTKTWNTYWWTLIKIIPIILIDVESFENWYHQRFIKIFDKTIYNELKYNRSWFFDNFIWWYKSEGQNSFRINSKGSSLLSKLTPREVKSILRDIIKSYSLSEKYHDFCIAIIVILLFWFLETRSSDHKYNYRHSLLNFRETLRQIISDQNYTSQLEYKNFINHFENDNLWFLASYLIDDYKHKTMKLEIVESTSTWDIEFQWVICKFPLTLLS